MSENYKEAFEKTRTAGLIAAGAMMKCLRLWSQEFKQVKLISYAMNTLTIMEHTSATFLQRFS